MFGFGAFGNFAYPTRRYAGAPSSGMVQSDDEFNQSWQGKVDAIPKTIAASGGGPVQLLSGSQSFDAQSASPFLSEANASLRNVWDSSVGNVAEGDKAGFDAVWDASQRFGVMPVMNTDGTMGLTGNPYTDMGGQFAASQGASQMVGPGPSYITNPEWSKAMSDWNQASALRSENQTRQQQAYNTMLMGDGQIGGVMTGAYSNPNFGQISGDNQSGDGMAQPASLGGFGGPSDLTGIAPDNQSGAYMPGSGFYNPSPFSPTAFRNNNPWRGY